MVNRTTWYNKQLRALKRNVMISYDNYKLNPALGSKNLYTSLKTRYCCTAVNHTILEFNTNLIQGSTNK